jgi:hypothetical protein
MPQPKSSSSRSRKGTATTAQEEAQERTQAALQALRERLTRGVVITAESVQETLDDAVRRGRVTRDDAQDLANSLMDRGRRQAEDALREVEALLGRGGDRVLRKVDRARRAARLGSFPILGYDDLDARQVSARLADLSPADLRKVRDHEQRNRKRKTVLRAIEKRLA